MNYARMPLVCCVGTPQLGAAGARVAPQPGM
jgi:hypothetical protein